MYAHAQRELLSYEVHQEAEKVLQFDFLVQLQLHRQAAVSRERDRETEREKSTGRLLYLTMDFRLKSNRPVNRHETPCGFLAVYRIN